MVGCALSKEARLETLAIRLNNNKDCSLTLDSIAGELSKGEYEYLHTVLLEDAARCIDELYNLTFGEIKDKEQ